MQMNRRVGPCRWVSGEAAANKNEAFPPGCYYSKGEREYRVILLVVQYMYRQATLIVYSKLDAISIATYQSNSISGRIKVSVRHNTLQYNVKLTTEAAVEV